MKITIATLALVAASSASAWEMPEDAFTQFPVENRPRDANGDVDHGRELWKYWAPPKAMSECFDYDKCKSCWMDDCTKEADSAYNHCRKWDEQKTSWMMKEDDKCGKKLNPSKAGDREMCQDYGECVYNDCGYDCDNVRFIFCCEFYFAYAMLLCPNIIVPMKDDHNLSCISPSTLFFFSPDYSARDLSVAIPIHPPAPTRLPAPIRPPAPRTARTSARNARKIAAVIMAVASTRRPLRWQMSSAVLAKIGSRAATKTARSPSATASTINSDERRDGRVGSCLLPPYKYM